MTESAASEPQQPTTSDAPAYPPPRRGRWVAALIVLLLLGCVCWFGTTFVAAFALCGVSGCGGGGFGLATPNFGLMVVALLIGGVVLAAPWLLPWTGNRAVRIVCAVVAFLVVVIFTYLMIDTRPGDLRFDFTGRTE